MLKNKGSQNPFPIQLIPMASREDRH